jgi:F420-non-reducing hydrogenase iron-sulfur subunit
MVIKTVLEGSGIDPERFALEWVSSAEAPRFTEVVTAFTEKIKALGPNEAFSQLERAV